MLVVLHALAVLSPFFFACIVVSGQVCLEDNDKHHLLQRFFGAEATDADCAVVTPIKCQDGACVVSQSECLTASDGRAPLDNLADDTTVGSTPATVVAITYCDAGFAPIWPTFIKCYEQALGCSHDGTGVRCGPSKPQLLDLGLGSPQPGKVGSHCARQATLAQTAALSHSAGVLTPRNVPLLIASAIAEQLALGQDVLRLDADAFLLANPMKFFHADFPDADIVSSLDCTNVKEDWCAWYIDQAFTSRHGGRDPFAEAGFMLNTGLSYIRSNPQTTAIARAAAEAIRSGRSTYEQTALNEELLALNCLWSTPAGQLAPGGVDSWNLVQRTRVLGKCDGGLEVVVLPYTTLARSMEWIGSALTMHPGGSTSQKATLLPNISAFCDKREVELER